MGYEHEIVSFPESVPLNIQVNRIGHVPRHWHQSIELIFIMRGETSVFVGSQMFHLAADDVLLINSNTVHEILGDDVTAITIQLKPDLVSNLPPELRNMRYACNSTLEEDRTHFASIKNVAAKLLKYNLGGGHMTELVNLALFYQLLYELYANFAEGTANTAKNSEEQLDRLEKILSLLNGEYREKLSLEYIAGKVHVTVPYLSKFFSANMGVTITEYLTDLRLYHAVSDLADGKNSIEWVAERNGFSNSRSFATSFRKKYGMLPSEWRSSNAVRFPEAFSQDKHVNYFDIDPMSLNNCVSQFIRENLLGSDMPTPVPNPTLESDRIVITKSMGVPLRHSCRCFIGVSRARELLMENIRNQLRRAQEEIGFRYIKVHGLLDDDMMVYGEMADGSPEYNFFRLDEVFDFLLSVRLRPLVQLSFMPSALAADPDKKVFWAGSVTSEPKDMNRWAQLVEALTRHIVERYGLEEAEKWLFSVWNEPSSSNNMFGFRNDEIFFELYRRSYDAVKSISPSLHFGGPSSFSTYGKNEDWLFAFLHMTDAFSRTPDFLDIHYYDIDLSPFSGKSTKKWGELFLSPVEDSFQQFLDRLQKRLTEEGYGEIPIYLTEWNSTVSHRDPLNDTCFKSAYIAKNLLENYDRIAGFGYWLLSDYHDEFLQSRQLFHGGLGLFTANGIPKPAYFAYRMLARLGDTLVAHGKGWYVTEQRESYRIILYNYYHYNDAYAREIGVNTTYTERSSVFPDKAKKVFTLSFPKLRGRCYITHTYVNEKRGSVFNTFVRMGGVEPLTPEDVKFLASISVPQIKKSVEECDSGLMLSVTLEPLEVRLIEISPYGQG